MILFPANSFSRLFLYTREPMTPVFNKKKQVKYGFQKAWPLQLQNAFPTVQLNMNIEKKVIVLMIVPISNTTNLLVKRKKKSKSKEEKKESWPTYRRRTAQPMRSEDEIEIKSPMSFSMTSFFFCLDFFLPFFRRSFYAPQHCRSPHVGLSDSVFFCSP